MSVYLITGASRGLGLEFIVQLLEGTTTNQVIAAHRSHAPTALLQLQNKYPERLTLVQLDVTNSESVKAAAAEVYKKHSHIDYLINNAGTGTFKSVDHITDEDFLQELNTNVVGVFRVTKEFLPLVKKSQKKVVVGLSSTLSSIALTPKHAGPFTSYRPSKAAMNALFATLQEEHNKDGISFALIHPGWVDTDMGSQIGTAPLKVPESVKGMLVAIHNHKFGDEVQLRNFGGVVLPW